MPTRKPRKITFLQSDYDMLNCPELTKGYMLQELRSSTAVPNKFIWANILWLETLKEAKDAISKKRNKRRYIDIKALVAVKDAKQRKQFSRSEKKGTPSTFAKAPSPKKPAPKQ